MEHLILTSKEPLHHEKIDEMVQIEGVAIAEGVWTDALGRTLRYPPNVLENAVKSFVGVPIIYPHTDNRDDMRKVIGQTTEAWIGEVDGRKAIFFRGLISDEEIGMQVLDGSLSGFSIEADFMADTSTSPPILTALEGEAIALTNRPACSVCRIADYPKRVKTIKLERKGGSRMSDEQATQKPVVDPETALEKIRNVVTTAYPMPKTKAWGDMTKEEKYGACMLFFKNQGYPIPYKKPKKIKDEITGEEKWDWPEGFEDLKAEFESLNSKIQELQNEVKKLNDEVTKRDVDEVNRLLNEIREIDPDFDKESLTKMEKSPAKQKVMLQTYLDNLKRLKPKFAVGQVTSPDETERMQKIVLEAFGAPLETIEQELRRLEEGEQ